MTRLSILSALLFAFAMAATPLFAQMPATQPGDVRVRFNSLERDDQKQVTDWTRSKMSNLAKLIDVQPDTPRSFKRNRLLNLAAARWRTYEQAKGTPALESVMRSVVLEDEIFGCILQLDDASADKRAQLKVQIQTKTRALVDLFLADRAERIARLRTRLDAEQKTLEADRAHANVLVEQRLARFMIEPTTKPTDDSDSSTAPAQ